MLLTSRTVRSGVPAVLTAALLSACGSESPDSIATSISAVAPAGSGATLVGHTIPATLDTGERRPVTVTYNNTGANMDGTNDWTSAYRLLNTSGGWFWGDRRVDGTVTPGNPFTFQFVITGQAAPGADTFDARIFSDVGGQTGFFGDPVNVPVTMNAGQQRRFGCEYVSDTLPMSMVPGETANVSVTIRNSGFEDWAAGRYCLYARDTPFTLWGPRTCISLNNPVLSGNQTTINFSITAPTTQTGNIPFRRQLFDFVSVNAGGVGFFDAINHCVDRTINVAAAPPTYNATFDPGASNHDDALMGTWAPNENRRVTITMNNSGGANWGGDGSVRLFSLNSPFGLWGPRTSFAVDSVTNAGNDFTFTMFIRAPAAEGTYTNQWRTWSSLANPNYFGDLVTRQVTVSNAAQRQFDAAIVSQIIPAVLSPNQSFNLRIQVRNTGWDTWTGSDFRLISENTPQALFGVSLVPLGAGQNVAPNDVVEFDFPVVAPAQVGSYTSNWRMAIAGGNFTFGAQASTPFDVVVGCGNGITELNRSEQCDDSNNTNGDGCSATCQIENTTLDLTGANADRTLQGFASDRDFGTVAIGDFDNDGFPDVAGGTVSTVTSTLGVGRALAGGVYVVPGNGFFTGGADVVNTVDSLEIIGERDFDQLGAGLYGSVIAGDVTGPMGTADGIDDLIVSAGSGACANGMDNCGRVYVIRGGADFPTGTIDLASPPANLVATLVGPADGSAAVALATGDLTGDGTDDLVIGLPGLNGLDGRVVVVPGGVTLSGLLTLSGGTLAADVAPAGTGDQLGLVATVGDVSGDGQADLIMGSGAHDGLGRQDAGGAWAVFGPVAGAVDLAGVDWDVRWFGAGIRDRLGSAFAVGNVAGTAANDLVIGVAGARFDANQRFGSVDLYVGPLTTGTTFDLSTDAPSAVFRGRVEFGELGKCTAIADVNGDGIGDILAGSAFATGLAGGLTQAGELSVILGGPALASFQPTPAGVPYFVTGTNVGRMCLYPRTLATGDIDADGRPDFCIGSPDATIALNREGRIDCIRSPF